MKKFSFRLEPVLKYKSDMLEILKNDHADSVKKVTEQNSVIERLKKEEQVSVSNFDSKKTAGITIAEAELYEKYLIRQNQLIKEETAKLNQLKKIEAEKRDKMVEAKKEMLSIEKLKDIKINEYRKEEQKDNELFIEEFISSRKFKIEKL